MPAPRTQAPEITCAPGGRASKKGGVHLIKGNFPQKQMLVQAKDASDMAFVCSYGQGLSPALQPPMSLGSLILPHAHPPGSSHRRLCPLPILF